MNRFRRAGRVQRLEMPSVELAFRGDINVTSLAVWREDRLCYGGATYLILDFGLRETLVPMSDPEQWQATGAIAVEIQRIDPDSGEGLSNPTYKDVTGEDGTTIAFVGWQLLPVSPRRPPAAVDDEPIDVDNPVEPDTAAVCIICGSGDIAHIDAGGNPVCAAHIGESPDVEPVQ